MLQLPQLLFGNLSCSDGTYSFEHIRKTQVATTVGISLVAAVGTRQFSRHHGATGNEYSGQIQATSGHQHTRNNLVAVGNQHQGVELMATSDTLDGVGNKLACYQGITHSLVSHGDSVTHTDGGEFDGSSSSHADSSLYGLANFIQINVAGNNFVLGTAHTNQGA